MTTWMGVKDIAKHLGVSKETIYRMLLRESIPAHKIGKVWRFDPLEVDKAVKRGDLK